MDEKIAPFNKKVNQLKLGPSFDPKPCTAFHSIRYDFKPASVDPSRESCVEVGEGHQVTVTVPHVQGSGTSHTVYKGNKKPCPKECVLIIDHDTGTFTLERLASAVQLKKTRMEGSSKQLSRPITPVDAIKQKSASPSKTKSVPKSPVSMKSNSPAPPSQPETIDSIGMISSSDSSSDSDSDVEMKKAPTPVADSSSVLKSHHMLKEDLQLSESGSDSD
ncbi:ELL-associated factor 2-like [Gigantopelta aegis]|uniref:ELL-associated factor 2-like n=1 Tax=Gigantopelta aegis TaxID=1735272 RepID=UPI001B88E184|nr:ELL-associated factor 2-like [Gigantopelta aegis]